MEVKKVCKSPKGTLSDLRPFLATKSPLKMMKVTSQQTIATHILLSTSRRTRPSGEGGGAQSGLQHFQSSLLMCTFLLISLLNMLFSKKVTENVHENQEAIF